MRKLSTLMTLALVLSFFVALTPAQAQDDALTFWTFEYAEDVDPFFEAYIEEWNATHDLQVVRQEFPWAQYTGEILTTGIATGEAPDVFFISPGDWRRYAESGLALPLEDYMPDYLLEDLLPASVEAVTLDGHIYSVPFEMEPVALWYNKTMLEEAGLELPVTWDALLAAVETLTTSERYGILIPTNPDYYENFVFYPFLWMAGADVVNDDFTAAAADTPEAARALDLWGTLVREGYAAPTSTGSDPTDERFPTGQAAMFVSGYWVYGWIEANYPEFLEHLAVAPIPAPDEGDAQITVYGGWTVMVYAGTDHPAEAAEFAINMFGAEDNARAAAWGIEYNTKLSPRQSVVADNADFYENFPHNVFANDIFPTARPEPSYPPEIAQAVWGGASGRDVRRGQR
ncbi:MAG: sugar ABC transporter substrate-binding protein [Anaerolineae bacterium]|nr:sugar ABC transporter substrate-binding protein [Anaerolineae bacterium]